MAVQPWQLETQPAPHERSRLELVAPPLARPSAAIAVAFLLLIVGIVGAPVLESSLSSDVPVGWSTRPQLPTTMDLDPIAPLHGDEIPKSVRPAGGMVFVSCTRLWTSETDGSNRRLIVEMPGISSPTFSPDGRTIAFFADDDAGQSLWLATADGAVLKNAGTLLIDGERPQARATALTWGARPDKLAFALVSNYYEPWAGGSAIVTVELSDGDFNQVGGGWPVPSWTDASLLVSRWKEGTGPLLDARERVRPPDRGAALTGRQTHHTTWWTTPSKTVSVVEIDGVAHLELRRTWRSRAVERVAPPSGTVLDTRTRPAITEDESKVIVTLVDQNTQERDVGAYDVRARAWTVLDYAWEADASPVPSSYGPMEQRRARSLAEAVLSYWGHRPALAQALMVQPSDIELLPMKWLGSMVRDAKKVKGGWAFDSVVYGPTGGRGFAYRELIMEVTKEGSRMVADVRPRGKLTYLRTVRDAETLLANTMGADFVAPVGLPSGTTLARFPVDLHSWNGNNTAHIRLLTPGASDRKAPYGNLTYSYGDEISLSFGCGGTNDPEETVVGDQPAITDHLGKTSAVIWPATLHDESTAAFGVSGELSKEQVAELATELESAR